MGTLYSNRGAKQAREGRAELGLEPPGPVPDLLQAIEETGDAHAVVLELPDGVAGAYVAKPDCPLLFVNGRDAPVRQRFTLAHEFGHHRMGHDTVIDEQTSIGGYSHDPNEVCANAFAAEFLMPRVAVAEWGRRHVDGPVTLEHVVLLASEYGVSAQAARYALETAGVITEARRCRQLDGEIEADLHSELAQALRLEPLHDELADVGGRLPRIPPALAGSALGDLLANRIDVDGLAARISRDPAEVRAMLVELGLDRLLPVAV